MGTPEMQPPRKLGEHPRYRIIWDIIQPLMREIDVETGNSAIPNNAIPFFDGWFARDGALFVTGSFTGSMERTKQVDPDWLEEWFKTYRPQTSMVAMLICAVALAIQARRAKNQASLRALDRQLMEFLKAVSEVTGQLFEDRETI